MQVSKTSKNCCRRRPSVQPAHFVCLRFFGPLVTIVTSLAAWVSLPGTIGSCVGVLHCLMFAVLWSWYQLKWFCSFKPALSLTIVELLDRFDIVVMEEPLLMLPSEPSNFCHNHFHFELTVLNNPLEAGSLLAAYGWYSLSRDNIRKKPHQLTFV